MAPVANATPEPTTRRVPTVVIVFGWTPARIRARPSGPIKATKPSLTRWGMRFIAGGKLISGENDGRAKPFYCPLSSRPARLWCERYRRLFWCKERVDRFSPSGCREVWVFDEPDQISKRIGDRRNPYPLADILNGRLEGRSRANKVLDRFLDIRDTPKRHRASRARPDSLAIRIQTELEATNVEPNVERLIEVWLDAEGRAVPLFGAFEFGNVVDHRT